MFGTNFHICFLALILLYFLKIKMILAQIPGKKSCQGVFRRLSSHKIGINLKHKIIDFNRYHPSG